MAERWLKLWHFTHSFSMLVVQSKTDRFWIMDKRRLGAQGSEISAIGIGAMSFSNFYGATDETQSRAYSERGT